MLGRFLLLAIVFIVMTGLALHLQYENPWLTWVGQLPGDLTIRKGSLTLYFPLTSSALLSAALTVVSWALFKPSK
jgi:hypothetical protein